jgi:hypothetical protein
MSDLHDAILETALLTPTVPPSTDIGIDTAAMAEAFEESFSVLHQTAESSFSVHTDGSFLSEDRQNFPRIRDIEDDAFKQLLLETVDNEKQFCPEDVQVTDRSEGTFSHCAMLRLNDGRRYAIKVPAQGTPELWTETDVHVWRSEVNTMKFIRRHTAMPVMQIFGWDASCSNTLGAPYMIQECAKGVRASDRFISLDEDGQPHYDQATASAIQQQCYQVFLHDLATKMAELHKFSFDKSGMLYFEEDPELENAGPPTVGPWFEYLSYTPQECGPFSDTRAFLHRMAARYIAGEKAHFENNADANANNAIASPAYKRLAGLSLFAHCAFSSFPSPPSNEPETFVLAHPDLDLQNIFVDHTGSITGIIDWQGTRAMPRPIGYASLPLFLRPNQDTHEHDDAGTAPPPVLDKYQEMYATYMAEALGGGDDARYTLRSAMCWFAFGAAMGSVEQNLDSFFRRMVKEVGPGRDMAGEMFLMYLSEVDVPEGAKVILRAEFARVFGG